MITTKPNFMVNPYVTAQVHQYNVILEAIHCFSQYCWCIFLSIWIQWKGHQSFWIFFEL